MADATAQNGLFARTVIKLLKPFFRSPARGADTTIHVTTAPELATTTGEYFVDRKVTKPTAHARDDGTARRLWERSAELVGLPG